MEMTRVFGARFDDGTDYLVAWKAFAFAVHESGSEGGTLRALKHAIRLVRSTTNRWGFHELTSLLSRVSPNLGCGSSTSGLASTHKA